MPVVRCSCTSTALRDCADFAYGDGISSLILTAVAVAAAIDGGNKTMTQILIEQGARAIGVQVDSFVCDGVIRLGYGYGDANRAAVRLTADEADELVKDINATVPVWGGTAPCGRAVLYGYYKKSTP